MDYCKYKLGKIVLYIMNIDEQLYVVLNREEITTKNLEIHHGTLYSLKHDPFNISFIKGINGSS